MSVLIFFAVWFLSGFALFMRLREDGDTVRDMVIITIGGLYSVLCIFILWLACPELINRRIR